MTFAAMAAWQGWLLLVGAVAFAAWLFLLKLRPPRVLVSSLLLWRRVLDESRDLLRRAGRPQDQVEHRSLDDAYRQWARTGRARVPFATLAAPYEPPLPTLPERDAESLQVGRRHRAIPGHDVIVRPAGRLCGAVEVDRRSPTDHWNGRGEGCVAHAR